ncbi:hypothetical protein GCK72_008113 [Caenorhabditis remanei]|uniref:Autophagy-related protein 2 n=1 Tax=Caenorhabditis remanei TaxID=31234 RepID=A0A6A5HLY2_CAERE|nr:hypothetical protein GCK72_008113 [Caenorhabditis remanei]KAF1768151.1 hypothetical protein GCK72_008113 [Caenorhabditis remanei]
MTLNSINKIWCKLVIQRYLGTWLENTVSSDQLSIQLSTGCLELKNLDINANAVNTALAERCFPFILVDGYIGKLKVDIPWNAIMTESSKMCIDDLQLTFKIDETIKLDDMSTTKSIIESVFMSFSTEKMIRSVFSEVSSENSFAKFDVNQQTTQYFSAILTSVLSRFCLTVNSIILRFESQQNTESDLATAVEVNVKSATFVDEQSQSDKMDDNEKSNCLNKKINLYGVSIHTDVFSEIYRSEKCSDDDMDTFYSCHEEMAPLHDQFQTGKREPAGIKLPSNPIICAEIIGNISCGIRLNDCVNERKNLKMQIDIAMDGVNAFATPSQIKIIERLFIFSTNSQYKMKYKNKSEVEIKSDVTVNTNIGTLSIYIPHCDYLSSDYVLEHGGYAKVLDILRNESTLFFKSVKKVAKQSIANISKTTESCYPKDHLRITGCSLKATARQWKIGTLGQFSCNVLMSDLNLLEFLTPESAPENNGPLCINLFNFWSQNSNPNFEMSLRTANGKTNIDVLLAAVQTEIDFSIINRIPNLVKYGLFFNQGLGERNNVPVMTEKFDGNIPDTIFNMKCPNWQVELRVPKTDFHYPLKSFSQRQVHNELVSFEIKNLDLSIPIGEGASIFQLTCSEIYGDLSGEGLNIPKEQKTFFYASENHSEKIKVELSFNMDSKRKKSKAVNQAGAREEMSSFQNGYDLTNVQLRVPVLRFHVPEKSSLQIFYNTLANGLSYFRSTTSTFEADSANIAELFEDVSHVFVLTLTADKCTVLCNTQDGKKPTQVSLDFKKLNIGATTGRKGDVNQTHFNVTSSKMEIGSGDVSNEKRIPNDISINSFGKWNKHSSQLECVLPSDEFSCGFKQDALAVTIRKNFNPDANTIDVLLEITIRNSQLHAKPFNNLESFWITHLSELFTLQEYIIPGYVKPAISMDLDVSLQNTFIFYDHSWVQPNSKLKFRGALGECTLVTSIVQDSHVFKTLLTSEGCRLYISRDSLQETSAQTFIPFLKFGSLRFDVSLDFTKEYDVKMMPIIEASCQNTIVMASVCADSLATLIQTVFDCSEEKQEKLGNTMRESVWNGMSKLTESVEKLKSNAGLPDDVQERVEAMIKDAMDEQCLDVISEDHAMDESQKITRKSGKVKEETSAKNFTVADNGLGTESSVRRLLKISRHEKPEVTKHNFFYPINAEPSQNILGNSTPTLKLFVKDVTLRLSLYAGNDLSEVSSPPKHYCTRDFKHGNSTGGPNRDQSAFVVFEFDKITLIKHFFDKNAAFFSTTLFEIGEFVIRDCVKASEIQEMLYQYSTTNKPRRESAPFFSVKMTESHSREGNMRVSMLPLKLNLDQNTVEFFVDFFDETLGMIDLPNTYVNIPVQLPIIKSPVSNDEILKNFTMMGTIHPSQSVIISETEEHKNFLTSVEDEPQPIIENKYQEFQEIFNSEDTFFKQFVFSPSVKIYIDYHGKRKLTMENQDPIVRFLAAFGQLNKMPITLHEINTRSGLLGTRSCFKYAVEKWSTANFANMPSVLASLGPIRPFVQVGKGVVDLFAMPVDEYRKKDGQMLKGVQKGVRSFGVSSANGIVGMAQTVTEFVQGATEWTINEINPRDQQMTYETGSNRYHQTKEDFNLTKENRPSNNSFIRSAVQYTVPIFLSPLLSTTQMTSQLLGGLRNQLNPDTYQDELRKWGEKKDN